MTTTTFVDGVTHVDAAWLNDVNNAVYNKRWPDGSGMVATTSTVTATAGQTVVVAPDYAMGTTALDVYVNEIGRAHV
mgnify:FL=1